MNLFNRKLFFVLNSIPVIIVFSLLILYSVNVPVLDDWDMVWRVESFVKGNFGFDELIMQHNESRIAIPSITMILISLFSGFDMRYQMFFSLFIFLTVLYIFYFRFFLLFNEKKTENILLLFLPVSIFLFSIRQYENFFWGFQQVFILPVFFSVLSVLFFEKTYFEKDKFKKNIYFIITLVLTFLCSFTISTGLFLWIIFSVGFFLNSQKKYMFITLSSGILTFLLFFHDYAMPVNIPFNKIIQNPFKILEFLLIFIGNSIINENYFLSLSVGVLIIFLTYYCLRYLFNNFIMEKKFFFWGIYLIFTIFQILLITIGRSGFGSGQAMISRYSTFSIQFLICIYVILTIIFFKDRAQKNMIIYIIFMTVFIINYIPLVFESVEIIQRRNIKQNFLEIVLKEHRQYSEHYRSMLFNNIDELNKRIDFLEQKKYSVFSDSYNTNAEFLKGNIKSVNTVIEDIKLKKDIYSDDFYIMKGLIKTDDRINRLFLKNNKKKLELFVIDNSEIDIYNPIFSELNYMHGREGYVFFTSINEKSVKEFTKNADIVYLDNNGILKTVEFFLKND